MNNDITISINQDTQVDLDFSIHQEYPIDIEVKQESNVSDIDVVVQQGTGLQNVVHSDDFTGAGTIQSPLGLSDDFKEVVESKVDKTTDPSKVYGTDSQGNQTTYDASSFGQVDDVLVNGVSVVENKIAQVTVPTKVSQLENDEQYLRPGNNVSELVNDAHYLTSYTHEQGEASKIWTVVHNLNRYPSVTVVDSAGTEVSNSVSYINSNTCEIKFNSEFKGTAYLN